MYLVCGLGNPGEKFKKTRHNLGRLAVSSWQIAVNFPDFKFEKKSNTLISKGIFDKKKILLALPEAFMNLSGQVVKSLTTNYKIPTTNIIVIHDDIDLPLGKIRISKGRGSAGHKGVESIIRELGTKDFIRLRIGIQPVEKPSTRAKLGAGPVPHRNKVSGAGFVLQKFNKSEEKIVKGVIQKSCQAIEMILEEGLSKIMAKYNQ